MERKLKTYFISVGKLETGQVVIFTAPGWDPDQSGAPSASGRRGSWWEFNTEHYAFSCSLQKPLEVTDPSGLAFPDSKWRQLYSRCLLNWWGVKNSGLFIGLGIQMTFLVFFYVYGFTNRTFLPKYLSLVLLTKTWMNHQRERYWKKLQAQYQSQTYLMDLSGMIDVRLQDTIPWVSIFPGELL